MKHVDRPLVDLAWLLLRTNSNYHYLIENEHGASIGARVSHWIGKLSHLA